MKFRNNLPITAKNDNVSCAYAAGPRKRRKIEKISR